MVKPLAVAFALPASGAEQLPRKVTPLSPADDTGLQVRAELLIGPTGDFAIYDPGDHGALDRRYGDRAHGTRSRFAGVGLLVLIARRAGLRKMRKGECRGAPISP
jgi:hypothetical protein